MTLHCSKCRQILPVESFYKHNRWKNREYRDYYCIPCRGQASRRPKWKRRNYLPDEQPHTLKSCSACKLEFPQTLKHFRPQKYQTTGLHPQCRTCLYQYEHQPERYSRFLAANRQRTRDDRLEALRHYGGPSPACACCKETAYEFLALDHVNNDGRAHRETARDNMASWLKRHNYPTDPPIQVLCHNCNLAKAFYGACPHTTSSSS